MNIFVGNLSKEVDEQGLHRIFRPYGLLKTVELVKDLGTGRFRGCAYVEMFSNDEAVEAIKNLNNKTFLGKRLMVNQRERYN
jgi:RNA recognition motif-containing protein